MQILRAMNGRGDVGAPSAAMSGGGAVRYYHGGGEAEHGGAGVSSSVISDLTKFNTDFKATVDKLVTTKFQIALDTTNVNVNFDPSFLNQLSFGVREELLAYVGDEIKKAKPNTSGDLKVSPFVLPVA